MQKWNKVYFVGYVRQCNRLLAKNDCMLNVQKKCFAIANDFFFQIVFLVTPDDMWTPYKQLHRVVETYLSQCAPEGSIANLELALQKHKTDFINLLKNSVSKSAQNQKISSQSTKYSV